MGIRRRARESAVKILYQRAMSGYDTEECIALFWDNLGRTPEIEEFTGYLVRGVCANIDAIDKTIERVSRNWTLARMHSVDLIILRLATFEMLYSSSTPRRAIINEAIELAKKFGTNESPGFINGLLDALPVGDDGMVSGDGHRKAHTAE